MRNIMINVSESFTNGRVEATLPALALLYNKEDHRRLLRHFFEERGYDLHSPPVDVEERKQRVAFSGGRNFLFSVMTNLYGRLLGTKTLSVGANAKKFISWQSDMIGEYPAFGLQLALLPVRRMDGYVDDDVTAGLLDFLIKLFEIPQNNPDDSADKNPRRRKLDSLTPVLAALAGFYDRNKYPYVDWLEKRPYKDWYYTEEHEFAPQISREQRAECFPFLKVDKTYYEQYVNLPAGRKRFAYHKDRALGTRVKNGEFPARLLDEDIFLPMYFIDPGEGKYFIFSWKGFMTSRGPFVGKSLPISQWHVVANGEVSGFQVFERPFDYPGRKERIGNDTDIYSPLTENRYWGIAMRARQMWELFHRSSNIS